MVSLIRKTNSLTAASRAAVMVLALGLSAMVPQSVAAQSPGPNSPILVLNQERLLSQSAYGRRIQEEAEAATAALARENRGIEAQLSAEELDLTERRDTLPAAEFRELADEFDTRVEGIRAAQEAKARDIQSQVEAARTRFFELTFPVLIEIASSRGAAVMLDNRSVLLSAPGIDITDEAIARIDESLGDGGPEPLISISLTSPAPDAPDAAEDEDPAPGGTDLPVLDLADPEDDTP